MIVELISVSLFLALFVIFFCMAIHGEIQSNRIEKDIKHFYMALERRKQNMLLDYLRYSQQDIETTRSKAMLRQCWQPAIGRLKRIMEKE